MNIFSIFALAVLIVGAILTYGAPKISPRVFKGEERDEVRDVFVIKLVGFLVALVGAVALFILKK